MSDFFGDDFTADLKRFFLKSLQDEFEMIAGAADEDTWQIFRDEAIEKHVDWIVDARTNEFVQFAAWLEKFIKHIGVSEKYSDFANAIDRAFSYTEYLHENLKDSEEVAKTFSLGNLASQKMLYLHCQISDQNFLVSVKNVLEVLGNISITPFPMSRKGFLGMIPFRGDAIPVINLADYGMNTQQSNAHVSYVVCEHEGARLALAVHHADRLIEVGSEELQEAEATGAGVISVPFLTHFLIKEDKNMMLFSLEKMVAA